jgi:chromosome segregation protein
MNPDTETLYLQQYNALNELKYIINNKIKVIKDQENVQLNEINIERLKAQKNLERLRTKIDNAYKNYSTEKDNLNNEIIEINKKLDLQESDVEKNNHQQSLKKIDEQNLIILDAIRKKQKELQSFEDIKAQYYETYQNDLFNVKIGLKGDKMAWNQRYDFLQSKLNSHQDDFLIFNNKWLEYHDNHINKVDDINETIDVLKEELNNSDINKKLERRDNLKIIQQCLSEKRNFKIQIKKLEEVLNNSQKEKEILLEKQQGWLKIVNEEYNLNIEVIKLSILDLENKINDNKVSISSVEKNIKNVELDISRGRNDLINSAWGLRQNLGELTSLADELNKKYQATLIELNKIIKTQNEIIENDPYKSELERMGLREKYDGIFFKLDREGLSK